MKKRFLAVAVASLMAMSLAACGGSSSSSSEAEKTTAAQADGSKSEETKALTERKSTLSLRDSSISSGKQLRRVQCRQEQI